MPDEKDGDGAEARKIFLALTPHEFDQLRTMLASWPRLERMIVAHERAEWFWSTLGIWIKWSAAVGAGLVAIKFLLGDFKELLRSWLKP